MRIGSVSGMGSMYRVSPYYTISSIHGNPKSLDAVDGISQQSESAKPLAIMKPVSGEEEQKIRQKQTMTAANDYESVMAQMMNGRNPENVVSSAVNTEEEADSLSMDNMLQSDNMERNSFNVADKMQPGKPDDYSVDSLQTDNSEPNDFHAQPENDFSVNDLQQNSAETVNQSIAFSEASQENMADALTKNVGMAQPESSNNYNQSGESQMFSYQMQRAIDAYTMAAGF